jgi:hypothetical protein
MQKDLAQPLKINYTFAMSNLAPIFANLYGQSVIILSTESSEYGVLAFVQFEDGREEEVPLCAIDLLD